MRPKRLIQTGEWLASADPNVKLTAGRWESYLANQEVVEGHLGADGTAMARQRAAALLEGGWGAVFDRIE